jgi:hypothetical protein
MPHIELSSASGYSFSCTSSDPATLSRWLLEAVTRLMPTNPADGPLRFRVWPMEYGNGAQDWPAMRDTMLYAPPADKDPRKHLAEQLVSSLTDWMQG